MLINTLLLFLTKVLPFFYCSSLLFFLLCLTEQRTKTFVLALGLGLLTTTALWLVGLPLSQLFDDTGYELLNLLLNLSAWLSFLWLIMCYQLKLKLAQPLILLIALSLAINGTGFLTYLGAYWQQTSHLPALLAGSVLGLSVCISICILLFFIFNIYLFSKRQHYLITLLSLHLAAQLSQAYVQLSHVNLDLSISTLEQLAWNSSNVLKDNSVTGSFLAATLGYESKPSLLYVGLYLIAALLPLALFYALKFNKKRCKE